MSGDEIEKKFNKGFKTKSDIKIKCQGMKLKNKTLINDSRSNTL
jgi:hypothetical protein